MNAAAEPKQLGRYELLYLLGQGGMGEVHLARLTGAAGFEKLCIVKTILPNVRADPQFVDRFHHEAKVLVHLNHSNIAQVYDMGDTDGTLYMAIEYVPGVDLARVVDRVRAMEAVVPVNVALYLGQQILEALGYAHRKKGGDGASLGIVHRDVSPHNVMVSYEGEVKVIDFGLAKSSARAKATLPATVLGKLGYMSPEQALAKPVDHRSDIYSAGIVLWELMTGRSLFGSGTIPEMMARMARPTIPSISELRPEVSPALEKIVLRALQTDPLARYDRADDFARSLNEIAVHEGLGISAEEVGNYVRAMCSGEYAAERALQSKLSSLAKRKSVVGAAPAPVEGTLMRAPASAAAAAGGFAPTMAPRSDPGLTPAQKALSQAGGFPAPAPEAFAPTMAPRSDQRLEPAPPDPVPARQPSGARRPPSNVVVATDAAVTDLTPAHVPGGGPADTSQAPAAAQAAAAAPAPGGAQGPGRGKGLLIAAVVGLVVLAAGGGIAIGMRANRGGAGGTGAVGAPDGLPSLPPLPDGPGKTGPEPAPGADPVATADLPPPEDPQDPVAADPASGPDAPADPGPRNDDPPPQAPPAAGPGKGSPRAPVPLGQVKVRKGFLASRDETGTFWVATGPFAKLQKGEELKLIGPAVSPGSRIHNYYAVGTVMEVLPRRARLSVSPADAVLPQPFGAALGEPTERTGKKHPGREAPVAAAPEPAPTPAPPAPAQPPARRLTGAVEYGGFGVDVVNGTKFAWTRCRVRIPPDKVYDFPPEKVIEAGSRDSVRYGLFRQDPAYRNAQLQAGTYGLIGCAEGTGYLDLKK